MTDSQTALDRIFTFQNMGIGPAYRCRRDTDQLHVQLKADQKQPNGDAPSLRAMQYSGEIKQSQAWTVAITLSGEARTKLRSGMMICHCLRYPKADMLFGFNDRKQCHADTDNQQAIPERDGLCGKYSLQERKICNDRLFDILDIIELVPPACASTGPNCAPGRKVTLGALPRRKKEQKSRILGQRSRKLKTRVDVSLRPVPPSGHDRPEASHQ